LTLQVKVGAIEPGDELGQTMQGNTSGTVVTASSLDGNGRRLSMQAQAGDKVCYAIGCF
jgi:hypothetical protein